MKFYFLFAMVLTKLIQPNHSVSMFASAIPHQTTALKKHRLNLYIDIHHFGPGKVKFEDVAKAHAKDLATQKTYGVHFLKYWVDETGGNVYCLASATNAQAIRKTHAKAHGLVPAEVYLVKSGVASPENASKDFYFDVHNLGAGKVTAKAVVAVHQKDLAVEHKYGVNLLNYWVDEQRGVVMCLSQAPDSNAIISMHREAHGLLPSYVQKVKIGM
jgi:hypothetical protein